MNFYYHRNIFISKVFRSSVLLVCFVLFGGVMSVSAQIFDRTQSANVYSRNILRRGMVEPFSSQMPIDVYQSRYNHRSDVKVGYQYRNSVSQPEMRRVEIMSGVQKYQSDSRMVLSGAQNNGYYTYTPQRMEATESKVTYNSLPTINSRGEVVSVESEEAVVETDGMQALPGNWGEPGMPIGDFALPMLLLVGVYVLVRFKGFNR